MNQQLSFFDEYIKTESILFHHLGLASRNPTKTAQVLIALGYKANIEVEDSLQKVTVCMYEHEIFPDIELIHSTQEDDSLKNILKHSSEDIYHICFIVSSVENFLNFMKSSYNEMRILLISPEKKSVLFSGKMISFYHVVGFGMIELVEDCKLSK